MVRDFIWNIHCGVLIVVLTCTNMTIREMKKGVRLTFETLINEDILIVILLLELLKLLFF